MVKLKTKVKKFIDKVVPILAMLEGVQHIIFSSISFWGIFSNHIIDWRVWVNPTADFIAGFVNIAIGIYWGAKGKKKAKPRRRTRKAV